MKWRSDKVQLIPGKWVSSKYPGHGILGSDLRATTGTGEHGAAPLFNDWDAGDDTTEFRLLIERWPTNGTLKIGEDSVGEYTGTADYAIGVLYANGVKKAKEGIGFFQDPPAIPVDPTDPVDPIPPVVPPVLPFAMGIALGITMTGQLVFLA